VEIEGSSLIGQFPASASTDGDEFGLVFDLDNPLVECVNIALAAIKDSGVLAEAEQKWLSDTTGVPVIAAE
jgi:polar amino acid transport system substrate-binding protein